MPNDVIDYGPVKKQDTIQTNNDVIDYGPVDKNTSTSTPVADNKVNVPTITSSVEPTKIPTEGEAWYDKLYDKVKKGVDIFLNSSTQGAFGTLNPLRPSYEETTKFIKPIDTTPNVVNGTPNTDFLNTVKNAVDAKNTLDTNNIQNILQGKVGYQQSNNKAIANELINLGFGYDKEGNLKAINTPSYTPEEININLEQSIKGINQQIANKNDEIEDTKHQASVTRSDIETKDISIDEQVRKIQSIDKSTQDKQKELEKLLEQKEQIKELYSGIYSTMNSAGSKPEANIAIGITQKGVDLNELTTSLSEDTKNRQQFISNPKAFQDYHIQNGIMTANVGDTYNQTWGLENKDNPDFKVNNQKYAIQSKLRDISSLSETIDRDKKILEQVDAQIDNNQKISKSKNIPVEEFQQWLDSTGIGNYRKALQNNIQARQKEIDLSKSTIDTQSPDYVRYLAHQAALDDQIKKGGLGLATAPIQSFEKLKDNLAVNLLRVGSWVGANTRKEFEEESFKASNQLTEAKQVPQFINSKGNLTPISEKEMFVYGKNADILPTNVNWDALAYSNIKMVTDVVPFLITGAAIEKYVATPALEALGNYLEIGSIAGEGSIAGAAYKGANTALKVANPIVKATTDLGIPSMMLNGNDYIASEMKKGLSFEQANSISLLRSYIDGMAMAIAPERMKVIQDLWQKGEIEAIAKDEAYQTLQKEAWSKITGKDMPSRTYNFLYGLSAVGKSYTKVVADISLQNDISLGLNSLVDTYIKGNINSSYQGDNKLTLERLRDNTLTAMATAFPFAALGGYEAIEKTKDARYNSLYTIVNSPEYFLNHINDRVEKGEITRDEALRQTKIIQEASAIHTGLKEDYDSVDKTQNIDDNKKAQLKFELFKNKVEQKGIIDKLSEIELEKVNKAASKLYDVTSEEGVSKVDLSSPKESKEEKNLLDYLKDNAKKYQAIKELQEHYNNLSYEDKLVYQTEQLKAELRQKYDVATLNDLTPEETKELRDEFIQKRDEADKSNPGIYEIYNKLVNRLDLKVQDDDYKSGKDTEGIKSKISDLADHITQFGTENLTPEQEYLRQTYPDLLQDELNKKQGVTPEPEQTTTDETTSTETSEPTEEVEESVITEQPEFTEPSDVKALNIGAPHVSQRMMLRDGDETQFESIVIYQGDNLAHIENNSSGDNGGILVDKTNPKLLINASNTFAYQARAFNESEDGFRSDVNDEINPQFEVLHSPDFNIGTVITLQVGDLNSIYTDNSRKQFIVNRIELLENWHITEDEYNRFLANPNNFIPIDILDNKSNIVGNIHALDYIREGRVLPFITLEDGTELSNLAPNLKELEANRKLILDRHNSKESLKTKVKGKNSGTLAIRADKKFKPLKEAFKNRDSLNNVQVVKRPEEVNFRGNIVLNSSSLQSGSVITIIHTPTGDYFGLPLKRTELQGQWIETFVNSIKFYREYSKDPKSSQDDIMNEWIEKTHDPTGHDIDLRTIAGLQNYLQSIIHTAKTSDFIGSNLDDDTKKDIPFIDINNDGSITFSNGRRNIPTDQDEKESIKSSYAKLKPIGVNKYDLHSISDETFTQMENELRHFLKGESLNVRADFMDKVKGIGFQIPILDLNEEGYKINNTPDVKNSGKDYPDFVRNNTHTNVLEIPIKSPSGKDEVTYFVQPTISVDLSFKPKEKEIKVVKDLETAEKDINFTSEENEGPSKCK